MQREDQAQCAGKVRAMPQLERVWVAAVGGLNVAQKGPKTAGRAQKFPRGSSDFV